MIVHVVNPTQTISRHCMEDNLILGLLLSKLLIHTELLKWKTLISPHNITTEKNVDCTLK